MPGSTRQGRGDARVGLVPVEGGHHVVRLGAHRCDCSEDGGRPRRVLDDTFVSQLPHLMGKGRRGAPAACHSVSRSARTHTHTHRADGVCMSVGAHGERTGRPSGNASHCPDHAPAACRAKKQAGTKPWGGRQASVHLVFTLTLQRHRRRAPAATTATGAGSTAAQAWPVRPSSAWCRPGFRPARPPPFRWRCDGGCWPSHPLAAFAGDPLVFRCLSCCQRYV